MEIFIKELFYPNYTTYFQVIWLEYLLVLTLLHSKAGQVKGLFIAHTIKKSLQAF